MDENFCETKFKKIEDPFEIFFVFLSRNIRESLEFGTVCYVLIGKFV